MKPSVPLCRAALLAFLLFAISLPLFARSPETYPVASPSDSWSPPAASLRADTTWYGSYQLIGGEYYAVSGSEKSDVIWTFDRGIGPMGDPRVIDGGEGWAAIDMTAGGEEAFFRVIDATLDLGGPPPPIMSGARSLWVGADRPYAVEHCWPAGAGYGNQWGQRVTSPPLSYNGSGNVTLSFRYFSDAEECFDGTRVILQRANGDELLLNSEAGPCDPGWSGGFTGVISPTTYTRTITQGEIGAAQQVRIVFEFLSDGGWSDEDGNYDSELGAFGADDVSVQGGGIAATYDFESGLSGWTASINPGLGHFAGVADVDCYTILDPCMCRLSGNILEFHEGECDEGTHPDGQYIMLVSPIVAFPDVLPKNIFLDLDLYADLPLENGVLFRPGWSYYPYDCNGETIWSPRVGLNGWNYLGETTVCLSQRYGATYLGGSGVPVPPTVEKLRALIEIQASCSAFTITNCTGITNPTPLFDNFAIGAMPAYNGPTAAFETGMYFQDIGSYPSNLFDVRAPGPMNTEYDKTLGSPEHATHMGDSLVVSGPIPTADTRWESRLWWRIERRGPFQSDKENGVATRYKVWKDRVSDGKKIDRPYRPEFTFGWMDSVQVGTLVWKNKFVSVFRENDDDFVGEGNSENEMLWDDVFVPGTRIQYFVTSNFVATPSDFYYYPDTTGGHFFEAEVLPGVRNAFVENCGGVGFDWCAYQPATLFIDAHNSSSNERIVESALAQVLNGVPPCQEAQGCDPPYDRNWDRYDYASCACWGAPFARGAIAGSNNGMTLSQVLGYRAILIGAGEMGAGAMDPADFALFEQWLTTSDCGSNLSPQVLYMNGDNTGELLEDIAPAFLQNVLGASLFCDAFHGESWDPDCLPENDSYCLRLLPVPGGPFGVDADVDAYGNACPNQYGFDVLRPVGSGIGNRTYHAEDGLKDASFSQIVHENVASNYLSLIHI
ncbi:MAG: hypothetical protein QUU85_09600 [Candidatus Eisenbacteria bacterium]|nr:hypothetical protein [Candidatus Eisenbacteria bacterium]